MPDATRWNQHLVRPSFTVCTLPSPATSIRRWGLEADKSQCIGETEVESRNALLLLEVPLPLLLLLLSAVNTSHIRVTRAAKHSSVD